MITPPPIGPGPGIIDAPTNGTPTPPIVNNLRRDDDTDDTADGTPGLVDDGLDGDGDGDGSGK